MARTDEESAEELMFSAPQKKARRWPWVVLATAVVGVVGMGTRQLTPRDDRSFRDHVSFAHGKIGAIIAAAAKKKKYDSSIEMVVDEYGANPPSALPIKAVLSHGGTGDFPVVKITFKAKSSTADLKKQLGKIFEAEQSVLSKDDPKMHKELEEAVKIVDLGKDGVVMTLKLPKGNGAVKEDEELKQALKKGKPKFTGEIIFARTFDEILNHGKDNPIVAMRGVEAKLNAVIADALIAFLAELDSPLPEEEKGLAGLFRSTKMRNELYYDKDKMMNFDMLPPIGKITGQVCGMLPPEVGKTLKKLDELDEVTSVVLEGLPYKFKLALTMKNFKPTPIVEKCAA